MIKVNMAKAREIWKDKMRAARAPILADHDVQYQRADEFGAAGEAVKARIAQDKQRLRDVTLDHGIQAAATPEELKAVWPAILGDKG